MHMLAMIVTDNPPDFHDLERIMAPFYESDFYNQYYDEKTEEYKDIPREDYPDFLWDYYTYLWTEPFDPKEVSESYTVISPEGKAVSRKTWHGEGGVIDQTDIYNEHVKSVCENPKSLYMTAVDYHD